MTVDEALAQIAIEAEPSEYCPLNVAHKVLRRYVEEVREVEMSARHDASGDQPLRSRRIHNAYGKVLAAAREGRHDD